MAGAFGRNHKYIEIGTWFDQSEMNRQTMRERQGSAFFQIVS